MYLILSTSGSSLPQGQVVVIDSLFARARLLADLDSSVLGATVDANTFINSLAAGAVLPPVGLWTYQYGYYQTDANLNVVVDQYGNNQLNPNYKPNPEWANNPNYVLVLASGSGLVSVVATEIVPSTWILLQTNANVGTNVYFAR